MNPVGWFEIYVDDMPRAVKFYETVLKTTLTKLGSPSNAEGLEMMAFPMSESGPGACGALAKMTGVTAGGCSTIVYFNSDDCAGPESRIAAAGGKVMKPKFSIGPYGFIVLAYDSEGNIFGVHSMK